MYIRRKVFSDNGYGYQPVEDTYNVTMSGEELRLFSDFCDYIEEERMYNLLDLGTGVSSATEAEILGKYRNGGADLKTNGKWDMKKIHNMFNGEKEIEEEYKKFLSSGRARGKNGNNLTLEEWKRLRGGGSGSVGFAETARDIEKRNNANAANASKMKGIKNWIKNNKALAAGIGAGAVLAGGVGAYALNRD